MTKTEKTLYLYTQKLFPQFSTPIFSRFSILFSELSENDPDQESDELLKIYTKESEKDPSIERYKINPKKILNGTEKRTTISIFEGLNLIKDKYKTFKGFDFSKIEIYFCKSQNINGLVNKYQKELNQKNFIICK